MTGFVKSIPDWFINVLRATKLVYLADRASMKKREFGVHAIRSSEDILQLHEW